MEMKKNLYRMLVATVLLMGMNMVAPVLEGATPQNAYKPNQPYTVNMKASVNKSIRSAKTSKVVGKD